MNYRYFLLLGIVFSVVLFGSFSSQEALAVSGYVNDRFTCEDVFGLVWNGYSVCEVEANETLNITSNDFLGVDQGITLLVNGIINNDGEIFVVNSGQLINRGIINNNALIFFYESVFINYGTLNHHSIEELSLFSTTFINLGELHNTGYIYNDSDSMFTNLRSGSIYNEQRVDSFLVGVIMNYGEIINSASILSDTPIKGTYFTIYNYGVFKNCANAILSDTRGNTGVTGNPVIDC